MLCLFPIDILTQLTFNMPWCFFSLLWVGPLNTDQSGRGENMVPLCFQDCRCESFPLLCLFVSKLFETVKSCLTSWSSFSSIAPLTPDQFSSRSGHTPSSDGIQLLQLNVVEVKFLFLRQRIYETKTSHIGFIYEVKCFSYPGKPECRCAVEVFCTHFTTVTFVIMSDFGKTCFCICFFPPPYSTSNISTQLHHVVVVLCSLGALCCCCVCRGTVEQWSSDAW